MKRTTSDRSSRTWALNYATDYFGFNGLDLRYVLDRISGKAGKDFLEDIWNRQKVALYHSPWSALRQEWFHTVWPRQYLDGFFRSARRNSLLLDYGCGTAEVGRTNWIDRDQETVLADLPGPNRDYLLSKYEGKNVVVTTPQKSLNIGPYDRIICLDVLEHIPNPIEALKSLWANLTPGGYGIFWFDITLPHPGHLPEAIEQKPIYEEWIRKKPIVVSRHGAIDFLKKPLRIWH